jgi:hypothetical protein
MSRALADAQSPISPARMKPLALQLVELVFNLLE